jgi:gas vesicle protein
LVGRAGGAYWPIAALIAGGGLIGFVCILLVRPRAGAQANQSAAELSQARAEASST